jgi:hypothetical protein
MQLKLRAYCSEHESASLTIRSPDNRVNRQTDIVEFTEIRIPVNTVQDGQNFWTITTASAPSKPFTEMRFYLYDEEFPYLITTHQ